MTTKRTATPVEVVTTDFEFAHGKKPAGRGGWAFGLERRPRNEDMFWFNGMYSDAKKAAVEHARTNGAPAVFVQS